MPFIDIKLAGPCLPENIEKFAVRMTALVVDVLHKQREVTAAAVQCIAAHHWHVGGRAVSADGRATFCVAVDVTAGSNTPEEKAAFVAAAFAAGESILGRLDAASYVIVRELAADAWGYQGQTQAARRRQD
jgi:4-oxalocrotonate tautomerase